MAWTYGNYTDNAATVAAKKKKEETEANKPGNYVAGAAVNNAQSALNNHVANKPGDYQSQWQKNLDNTINKILNREKFSYDLNGDALYQMYKDQFDTRGEMAMMDTMGQAAAMTGGYGNSYAQSVGQQAYQGYLQQLNDKVPELYKLALDQYNRGVEDLYNQYGLLSDRENQEYGRYRDNVADWSTERDYLAGRYDTEYSKDYNQYRDSVSDWQAALQQAANDYYNEREFGYGQYSDDRNLSYTDYRNAIADQQWKKQFDARANANSGGSNVDLDSYVKGVQKAAEKGDHYLYNYLMDDAAIPKEYMDIVLSLAGINSSFVYDYERSGAKNAVDALQQSTLDGDAAARELLYRLSR